MHINKVQFDNKWFNPLFHILWDIETKYPNIKHVYIYGGKSSTKTYTVAQFALIKAAVYGKNTLAFRKVSDRMNETLISTFKKARRTTKVEAAINVMDKEFRAAKAHIKFKGLDSEDSAKGIENYSYMLFDELDQFSQEEYEETRLSFRGEVSKMFFCTWNPVSEHLWIKPYLDRIEWIDSEYKLPSPESFIKMSADGARLLIKTDYNDNYWSVGSPCETYGYRDEALIRDYEQLKTYNYNKYRVVVLGEWGITEVKSPAVQTFDVSKHVGKVTPLEHIPLLFWIDFNIDPLACTVWQIFREDGKHKIRGIREITIKAKEGIHNTQQLIDLIKLQYATKLHSICFTGDATGAMGRAEGLSNWIQINKAFNLGRRLQVPKSNPSVLASIDLLNYVFYNHPDILLDESMTNTIFELQHTEKDDKGLVKKNRNLAEQRADFIDCIRYGFSYWFMLQDDIQKYPHKFGIK